MSCVMHEIEVRNWRGLDDLIVQDLSPDKTVIFGLNESGKTRLAEAIHFAFFESHRGNAGHKRDLETWDRPGTAPRVRVDCSLDGVRYTIEKQFLKHGYTQLAIHGSRTLKDEAALEEIQQLFGQGPASTRTKTDQTGIWRLLMVLQGESHQAPREHLDGTARADLEVALQDQVGLAPAGPMGEAVLQAAEAQAGLYWTTKKAKPKTGGPLESAHSAVESASAADAEARRVLAEANALAQTLEDALTKRDALVERVSEKEATLADAEGRMKQVSDEKHLCESARQKLQTAQLELEAAESRLAQRDEAEGELANVQETIGGLEEQLVEDQRAQDEAESMMRTCNEAVTAAEQTVEQAKLAHEQALRAAEYVELQRSLEEATETLDEAKEHRDSVTEVDAELAVLHVDDACIDELRRLERALLDHKAVLEGAAARLKIEALDDIALDGAAMASGEHREWDITQDTTVTLDGVATVQIQPGGKSLGALSDAVHDAQAALDDALADVHVSTVSEAEAQLKTVRGLEKGRELAEAKLEVFAPTGIDDLERDVMVLQTRLGALPEEIAEEELVVETTEADRLQAEEALGSARALREGHLPELDRSRTEVTRTSATLGPLRESVETVEARLSAMEPREGLEADVETRQETADGSAEVLTAREASYAALGGDEAVDEVEQDKEVLASLRRQLEDAKNTVITVRANLSGLYDRDVHEASIEAAAELELQRVRLERTEEHAVVRRLLLETLQRHRREAQQQFSEPVRERIESLIKRIAPNSVARFDDQGMFSGYTTGHIEEPFDKLSRGTREVQSIAVRAAMAYLLTPEGDRNPFILDDPFVWTDPERRKHALRWLSSLTDRLQLIVFTCHGAETFDDLAPDKVIDLPRPAHRVAAALPGASP